AWRPPGDRPAAASACIDPSSITCAARGPNGGPSMARSRVDASCPRSERRRVMSKGEPPPSSCSNSSLFLVGKNSRGNWVVQDQEGLCGGLFVDRTQAVKFAMFENGHRPQAVIMVPGVLELDMSGKRHTRSHDTSNTPVPLAWAA